MIRNFILAAFVAVALTSPVKAGPLYGIAAAAGKFFAGKTILATVARFALSHGLSLLAQKLRGKPKEPGLQNRFKGRGGSEPETFILGRHAVLGHQVYHNSNGTNNRFYNDVLELCGLPGATLLRVIIDGEYSSLGVLDGELGKTLDAKTTDSGARRSWINYYDGTQTTADPMLVDRYASDPDHPWTTDHLLSGKAYVVHTSDFDRKQFRRGVSELRFEMMGIPMYDPRQDSTVGGSGAHRWNHPSSWSQTENLVVLIYNVMRGITLPNGAIWGGGCAFEDLPIANWVAGMNACDVTVDGRAKYRGGIEVKITEPPLDTVEELMSGCAAQMSELGGVWRIQVDAPATAAVSVSDDDMSVSHSAQSDPFPGLESTFNAITVVHPDPEALWSGRPAATIKNATWEAEDGTRRVFDLKLAAVPYPEQAKQIANLMLNENRRFRRHKRVLPPEYFFLETLQTIAWTSEFYGYSSTLFEVSEIAYDPFSFNTHVSLRERNPADFTPDLGLELPSPTPPTGAFARPDAGVPDAAASGVILSSNGDVVTEAGVKFTWTADEIEELALGIAYEIRVTGAPDAAYSGTFLDLASGAGYVLTLRGASYEWRMRALSNHRETDWNDWVSVSTPGQRDAMSFDSLIWNPLFADGAADGWDITDTPAEDFRSDIVARADYGTGDLAGRCPFEHMVRFAFGDNTNMHEYAITSDGTTTSYPFASADEKVYLKWSNFISVSPEEALAFQFYYATEISPFSAVSLIVRVEFFDEDQLPIATTEEASVAQVTKPVDDGFWQPTHWSFVTPASCAYVKVRLITTQSAFGFMYLTDLRLRRALATQDIAIGTVTESLRVAGTNLVPSSNNSTETVMSGVFEMDRLPQDNASSEAVPVSITVTGFVNGTVNSEYFLRVNGFNVQGINLNGSFNLSLKEEIELPTGAANTIALTMRTPNINAVELLSARLIVEASKR